MVIRKKSDKELKGEIRGFLDYAQDIGKISIAKGDEIFYVLSQNNDNIKNKKDLKGYMSSVLSSDEFDHLYDDYINYYGDAGKYIKDFFEKNKFFPEGYDFLISNLFRFLYEDSYHVDSLIKELNDMSADDIDKWRIYIKRNIDMILSIIPNEKNFRKLDRGLIFYNDPEDLKENITILQDCGIHFDNVDDINKFAKIITMGNYSKNEPNLHVLIEELNISNPEDLVCLGEIIKFGNTEKIKENIPALKEVGISKSEDLIKLKDVIYDGSPDKIKSNIPVLIKFGITDAENLSKFKYLINNGNSEVLNELQKVGIDINDRKFDWILNTIINGKPGNITALKEIGIDVDIDTIKQKLGCIITDGIPENIIALKNLGLDISIYNINQYDWFFKYAKLENVKFLKDLGISVNSADNLKKNEYFISDGNLENIVALNDLGIEIDSSNFSEFSQILVKGVKENIQLLSVLGINRDSFSDLENFKSVLVNCKKENISTLNDLGIKFGSNVDEALLIRFITQLNNKNIEVLINEGIFCDDGIENRERMKRLDDILTYGKCVNIEKILDCLDSKSDIDKMIDVLCDLKPIITGANTENLITVLSLLPKNEDGKIPAKYLIDELLKYYNLLCISYGRLQDIINTSTVTKEDDRLGYLVYLQKIACLKNKINDVFELQKLMKDILGLTFSEIDNYLDHIKEFCINKNHSYDEFLLCFDGKNIDENMVKYSSQGFEIRGAETKDDLGILNNTMRLVYPNQNIRFNELEAQKIFSFVNHVGGINKGYSILILTIEKMIRDGVDSKIFNKVLCNKLDNYLRIIDMYPENKIPEGLRISMGMEIEMTRLFANRYNTNTGNDYRHVVNNITKNAKLGQGRDGIHEFATKPSTNPMTALLEIHLLQELNLLDINDMQKLSGNTGYAQCSSRNGTGYHLNIGSDSDIGIDENIDFIQNLCTILPWSGMSNGDNVRQINRQSNANSKSSNLSVFKSGCWEKYVELRTYSVDDVEFFEKNVLFNTYAVMGSQAQKKVSNIDSSKIIELKDNVEINDSEVLMNYLEKNNLFKENQDLKSKMVAVEFIWMQICVLRNIDNYNKNFIDDELFGKDLIENLSEPWKNCFLDLLLSDKKETIGFVDTGHSSLVVNKYTNLKDNFDAHKYIQNNEPFTDVDSKIILSDLGNTIDEKWIPYVTTWLNKQLLWAKLCEGTTDTQELQDNINSKMSNIDRIKSYLRGNDQNLKVDRKYLYDYFREEMSLSQFNPYHAINIDFVNKIINLNNFFLKKDDTNAHGVLQYTKYNGKDEADISKLSIFETGGKMRKGYNYYQGGSEDMLIHSAQKIALSYMENVKDILNTDYDENNKTTKNGIKFNLAA